MSGILSKQHIIAEPGFNRWKIVPAALGIHLCIGSVYAWSIFNPALVKQVGVVISAADDWTLKGVVWIFTVSIVVLGLAAAIAGRWLETVGPRMVGVVSACCWGGGFIVGGIGIITHQLWLLYLGYGVLGGCGLGLGYVSPGEHADPLVPGPPRHGHGDGDNGFRRRRHDRRAPEGIFYPVVLPGARVPGRGCRSRTGYQGRAAVCRSRR